MATQRDPRKEFILVLQATERAVAATWEIRQTGGSQALDSESAVFADREAAYHWGVLRGRAKGFVQIVTIDRIPGRPGG